jgi:hypothetical protein
MKTHIQRKIFEYLKAQKLTIDQMEKKADLNRGLVRGLLNSKFSQLKSLFRLAFFLEISLEELTGVQDVHLLYKPTEMDWDAELYEKSVLLLKELCRQQKCKISFSEAFSFIEGLYVYSACQAPAPSPLDGTFGRWLFEMTVLKNKKSQETQLAPNT